MDSINSRINRLIGQIEGVRKMIAKRRATEEIAQQILAAREALSKIGILVLKEGIGKTSPKNGKRVGKLIEKVFRM